MAKKQNVVVHGRAKGQLTLCGKTLTGRERDRMAYHARDRQLVNCPKCLALGGGHG